MTRFNATIASGALIGLAAVYMVIALATGHSARAEPPPDLSARGAGLDVWKTLALLIDQGDQVRFIDVRPAEQFQLYHVAGSRSLPGAGASELRSVLAGAQAGVLIASSDEQAARLVGEASAGQTSPNLHFLQGGVQGWYLALELPVPLFADKEPPHGYAEAMRVLRSWLDGDTAQVDRTRVREAVGTLATAGYDPSQLAGKKKKPAASGKKKISGGCG
ncbi:MAG: rhodanese-like domain-containing protein [Pseudomonadota bacterium]